MPLARTADLVAAAHRAGTGLADPFNVITLEHAEAIAAGAERANGPVIMQISENAVKFHHGRLAPIATAVTAVANAAAVQVSVNPAAALAAVEAGKWHGVRPGRRHVCDAV